MKNTIVSFSLFLFFYFVTNYKAHSQELEPFTSASWSDELMGYKDKSGNVVIPAKYTEAYSFVDGLAKVQKKDANYKSKYGFIDITGKEVIPLIYDDLSVEFSDGLVGARLNDKWGFLNKQGEVVLPFIYDYTHNYKSFREGLSCVAKNGRYGFIDKQGKEEIPFQYEDCRSFSGGLSGVKFNGKWAVINKEGKLLTPFKYKDVSPGNPYKVVELVTVSTYNEETYHSYGVVDKRGVEVIPVKYKSLTILDDNLFRVSFKTFGEQFVVNRKGKIIE